MGWEADNILTISLHGTPKGWSRAGHRIVKSGKRLFVQVYTPTPMRKYQESIAKAARAAMAGRPPLQGALSVSLRFRMPIPKSASKRARAAMAAGEVAHTSTPDKDNMTKAIYDALNKIVWRDDAQITRGFQTKGYAEQPGVDVRVEAFAPQGGEA
jgi:Holliday junction resolvase RusA-like endonuclease